MTPRQRAERAVAAIEAGVATRGWSAEAAGDQIASEIVAAVLEERRAIVAYLRRWVDLTPARIDASGMDEAAGLIERGEHEARS